VHISGAFELVDREGGGLLGDAGPFGEVGEPGAFGAEPGQHARLSDGDVVEPGRGQVGENPILHGALDDEAQQSDVERTVVERGARVRRGNSPLLVTRHAYTP
jgi:hypothetical protein